MVGVCEPPGCGWPCTGAWCGGAYTEAGGFGMSTGPAGWCGTAEWWGAWTAGWCGAEEGGGWWWLVTWCTTGALGRTECWGNLENPLEGGVWCGREGWAVGLLSTVDPGGGNGCSPIGCDAWAGGEVGICPPVASLVNTPRSDMANLWVTGGILAKAAGNLVTSFFMSDSNVSNWFRTLWRTALAGLLPDRDSLDKCWWLSARHSNSENLCKRVRLGNFFIKDNVEILMIFILKTYWTTSPLEIKNTSIQIK